MRILGIETSCDETAAAVVVRGADGSGRIASDVILSQVDAHAVFGGVVPEIAARAHVEALDRVIAAAMREGGVGFGDIDAVAATAGPGLIGGVIVGLTTAKAIALAAGKPLVAVNHLEGHALTARLTDGLTFPYLLLLVSGGHTQFVAVEGVGRYRRLGSTIDDALGEAFDKAAKLLGLGYPGGPAIETAAERGDPRRFALPRPLLDRPEPDFSLSGLKTALRLAAERIAPLSARDVDDLAASFQAAVTDVVADRAGKAMRRFAAAHPGVANPALVIAGGVAANKAIRARLVTVASQDGFRLVAPPIRLCADNAVMIAWAGAERLALGLSDPLEVAARPRWPLDEMATPLIGSGQKGAKA
jgi:N6-L-threonylcarbamoyladenine synthase